MEVVFADPSHATLPLFFWKSKAQRTMKLLSSFYRGKGLKMQRAFGYVHLASVSNTFSLVFLLLYVFGGLFCDFYFFFQVFFSFFPILSVIKREERCRSVSAELVFADTLLSRTSGRGTFCFRTPMHPSLV